MTDQTINENLPFPISTKLLNFYRYGASKIRNSDTMKIFFYYGFPGCGKSLAAQRALYIINNGDCKQEYIGMDKPEFIRAVLHNRKKAVIADEGISVLFSRAAMSQRGRESVELFGQMRIKNLFVLVCIHDILLVDKSILKMGNAIIRVYETEEIDKKTGESRTIKGNLEIYPKPTKKGATNFYYKLLKWERINQAANYLIRNPKPRPAFTEPGQRYQEDKPPFYPVDMEIYRNRKDAVLKKYDKPERKHRNASIDFAKMDKLLALGMKIKDIMQVLNCSKAPIMNRKAQGYYKGLIFRPSARKKKK
jgi:hypothetical protein